jgi:protein AaeX
MPREITFLDALLPSLVLVLLASVVIHVTLDRLLGRCCLYRYVWHPALFRLSVFVCIFAGCGIYILK